MSIQDVGDNARRLMKIRGLSIPELSQNMGMGAATVSNLLNGKTEPKSSTLIKLAESLGVPLNQLLSDAPSLSSLRFRTLKTLSGREKAEREQLRHDTALWLANYVFLENTLGNHPPRVLGAVEERDPASAAVAVRNALGLGPHEPIYDITGLVAKAGIKLRIKPFGFKKTFGLSIGSADGGPGIVVNAESGISTERQIFTVAHELGHLVLHTGSYQSPEEEENPVEEQEADRFAGNLLLPEESLRREWAATKGLHWVDAVLRIKKVYKVSYMTVLVRLKQVFPALKDRNLLLEFRVAYKNLHGHDLKDPYEPNAIEDLIVAKDDPDALGSNDLVEDRFSRLVREAYEQEEISLSRAAEILGRPLSDMRLLVKAWQEISPSV